MNGLPLECRNLVKNYGDFCAVKGISFSVDKGEIFGLLGPNGAGKTTTISMITTLSRPTSGEVRIFGKSVVDDALECKKQFGVVPQEIVSHGFFNVEEVLDFHSGYYGVWRNKEYCHYLIKRMGLWEQRKKLVSHLSGGMKRRLLIAKALVHKPPLILLDEPTAGVDIELRESLWEFIRELKGDGCTILLTTHVLSEAEELCDRVAIIDAGEIKRIGDTQQMIREVTAREITITFLEAPEKMHSSYLIKQEGDLATFRVPHTIEWHDLVQEAKIPIERIREVEIREGTLEDAVRKVLNINQGAKK